MDICPGFWDWIITAYAKKHIASISLVRDELEEGKDKLWDWVRDLDDNIFLDITDEDTQKQFIRISDFVERGDFKQQAKAEFLDRADPWLIAKAKVIGATVVTHETYEEKRKNKVKIPNVCKEFGVDYIDTFKLLRKHTACFILRA